MKREVTNLEGLLIMTLLVMGIVITLSCTGCATAEWEKVGYDVIKCRHRALAWMEAAHSKAIAAQTIYYKKDNGRYHAICKVPVSGKFIYVDPSLRPVRQVWLSEREKKTITNIGYRYK